MSCDVDVSLPRTTNYNTALIASAKFTACVQPQIELLRYFQLIKEQQSGHNSTFVNRNCQLIGLVSIMAKGMHKRVVLIVTRH